MNEQTKNTEQRKQISKHAWLACAITYLTKTQRIKQTHKQRQRTVIESIVARKQMRPINTSAVCLSPAFVRACCYLGVGVCMCVSCSVVIVQQLVGDDDIARPTAMR